MIAMQNNSCANSDLSRSNLSYFHGLWGGGGGAVGENFASFCTFISIFLIYLPRFVYSFQYSWSISKPVLQILFELAVSSAWSPHWLMSIINSEHMFILCPYESQHFAFLETYPEGWSHSTGQRWESVQMEKRRETRLFKENDGQGMVTQ